MNRKMKTAAAIVLATSLLAGCMGKFALTGKIYAWNKKAAGDRWVNEMIFVAFLIIPVYNLALLADGIVFNSIQWWTGQNPVAQAGDQKRVQGEDGSVALMTLRADGAIDVEATSAEGVVSRFTLQRVGDQVAVTDARGLPLGLAAF